MTLTFEQRVYADSKYKAIYQKFCVDGSWDNRLALESITFSMLYEFDYTEDDISGLQDEVLEELEEEETEIA